ncbi:MAG: FtsX-like permease family protein [Sphingomonas sp.]
MAAAGISAYTILRGLIRHPLYAALNIGGLALGLAVFLVLFLFVAFERGYDRGWAGADGLWAAERTMQFPGLPRVNIPVKPEMLEQLRSEHPGISGTRFTIQDMAVRNGVEAHEEKVATVDPNYFSFFPATLVSGDLRGALAVPGAAVVTERIARDYLGQAGGLGKVITLVIDGKPQPYRVAAIIDDVPRNRSYRADIFVQRPKSSEDDPSKRGYLTTVIKVPAPEIGQAIRNDITAFSKRHPDTEMGAAASAVAYDLKPVVDLHLAEPRDRAIVTALGLVGALALLIAVVNYINLATARAGLRAREVAMRKVVGATRRALVWQFMVEALLAVVIATLAGLALVELALPHINALGGTDLALSYSGAGSVLPAVALMVVGVTLLAGLYPAVILSAPLPAATLASASGASGGRVGTRLRRALVLVQFAISITLGTVAWVLIAQTNHLAQSDVGFDRDGLIVVSSSSDSALDPAQYRALFAAHAGLPGVERIAVSGVIPGGGSFFAINWGAGRTGLGKVSLIGAEVGPGFFETYGAHLLAGRWFDARHALDDNDLAVAAEKAGRKRPTVNVVLNKAAARAIGFATPEDAIGKTRDLGSGPVTIIGIVADIRFGTPLAAVEPTVYSYRGGAAFNGVITVRVAPERMQQTLDALRALWRRAAPDVPFLASSARAILYDSYYKQDVQRGRLFTLGAVLAAIIGSLGLYGLAAFDTGRRVREIGIRKALGASTQDILRLLVGQFLRPVLIANLIAWPVAWIAMRAWLAGFDDRITLSPLYFLGASLAALAIAALTVSGSALIAARTPPATALRHE